MIFGGSYFLVTSVLIYLIPVVVITVLAYLVLRFAIRDGLRAHTRWLANRPTPTPTSGSATSNPSPNDK